MKLNETSIGLILIVAAVILWDASRPNSFLRAASSQLASIGLNDFFGGLFA
jgi:hypothetical protein